MFVEYLNYCNCLITFKWCVFMLCSPNEVQLKYVYFNQMNLAQKTSVHHDGRKGGNVNIPQDILKLMADLQQDLSRCVTAVLILKLSLITLLMLCTGT